VEGVAHQLVDVHVLIDLQLLQHLLVIKNALDDVELLPLNQDLPVGQQQGFLLHVVVDGL
jgi:hypothetical protein